MLTQLHWTLFCRSRIPWPVTTFCHSRFLNLCYMATVHGVMQVMYLEDFLSYFQLAGWFCIDVPGCLRSVTIATSRCDVAKKLLIIIETTLARRPLLHKELKRRQLSGTNLEVPTTELYVLVLRAHIPTSNFSRSSGHCACINVHHYSHRGPWK